VTLPKTPADQAANPFPRENDVVVKGLNFIRAPGLNDEGGVMSVGPAVAVRDQGVFAAVGRLREETGFQVPMPGIEYDRANTVPGYPRKFDLKIRVPAAEEYVPPEQKKEEAPPAAEKSTSEANSAASPAAGDSSKEASQKEAE
jgi:hypothetical protein